MSLRLKPELVDEIKTLLREAKCSEVRSILEDVSKRYKSINTVFIPDFGFEERIEIEPDLDTIINTTKCVDEKTLWIRVFGKPRYAFTINNQLEMNDLNQWLQDPFIEDEAYMIVKFKDYKSLEKAVALIGRLDKFCYIQGANKEVNEEELIGILEKAVSGEKLTHGACDYIFDLLDRQPKILLLGLESRFWGRITVGKVSLFISADIGSRYRDRYIDKPLHKCTKIILESVKEIYETYKGLGPEIILRIEPPSW